MLFVSMTGFQGTFDPDPTTGDGLAQLKKRVDSCISDLPLAASNDTTAGIAITCSTTLSEGMDAIEKLSFIDDADNAIVFNIARSLLTEWRNTDLGVKPSSTEERVRRIAAAKLGEDPVVNAVSATLAVQTLASAGRIESNPRVQLRIVVSLMNLLSERDIPASVRAEAITTLKIYADPLIQKSPDVKKGAEVALQVVDKASFPDVPEITIGPATVTPVKSSKLVPVLAIAGTAVAAAGVLWYVLWHRSATQFSGVGRLRRKVETRRRQRRSRSR
jgi:hypothetical protein